MDRIALPISRRRVLKGSAAALATVAAPAIIRAQGSALNVGVHPDVVGAVISSLADLLGAKRSRSVELLWARVRGK